MMTAMVDDEDGDDRRGVTDPRRWRRDGARTQLSAQAQEAEEHVTRRKTEPT